MSKQKYMMETGNTHKQLKITYQVILTAILFMLTPQAWANNIAVTNVSLTDKNITAGTNNAANFISVKFDLSWENSWRTSTGPANWDAAWVFVKFRVGASNPGFTGVSSSGTTVTVSSTANLRVGMPVLVRSGTGAFAVNTVISSIINATQFVVSATPTTALSSANIECARIWEHALLNNIGHIAPNGSNIDAGLLTPGSAFNATTNPALGVFIYRNANGSGSNAFNNARLRWNYGANGVADDAVVDIRVSAIEMVYAPGGSFSLGDGSSSALAQFSAAPSLTTPFQVTAESQLTLGGTAAGNLRLNTLPGGRDGGLNEDFNDGTTQILPAAYPKGFSAFYCMKYELTQGMYRDFLNTLTFTQQASRTISSPLSAAGTAALTFSNRNGLVIGTAATSEVSPAVYACNLNSNATYNESSDGEWIPCGYLSWGDVSSFLDWSGLRPMSELEYEKACRGTLTPVANELAWGTTSIAGATGPSNGGTISEVSTLSTANCNFGGSIAGPVRVGAFANSTSTREQAGASFYGIMEMTGNLWERVIPVSDATGRAYTGLHGDGMIQANGLHDVTAWPGGAATAGFGFRGGRYSNTNFLAVSDRTRALDPRQNRIQEWSGRGVRTAGWSPAQLGSNLALWLDAADASTITTATGVSEWRDKSGNGRHFGQTTANMQPAYIASGINGLGSLSYDGVNDVIERASGSWGFEYPMTHFIVFRPISYNQPYSPLFEFYTDGAGTNAGWSSIIKSNGNSAVYMTSTTGQPNYDGNGALTYPINNNYIFSSTVGDNSIQSWGNGSADGALTSTWTSRINPGATNFQIGASTLFSRFPTQQIGEVIILRSTASQATRQLVEGYLAWKWGLQGSLPVGHPYKNAAP